MWSVAALRYRSSWISGEPLAFPTLRFRVLGKVCHNIDQCMLIELVLMKICLGHKVFVWLQHMKRLCLDCRADEVIATDTEDLVSRVKEITGAHMQYCSHIPDFPSCISSFLFHCSMHVIGIMACSTACLMAKTISACTHACMLVSLHHVRDAFNDAVSLSVDAPCLF